MKTTKNPFGTPFGGVYSTPSGTTDTATQPQQDPKKQNLTQGRSKDNEISPYIKKDR